MTFPDYTLFNDDLVDFEHLWLDEIQYFKEVPYHNNVRSKKAKEFAARVYALAIEKQKNKN